MYVFEESDCSIVPMNHSNKDGVSSAESEEGRLRMKENTSIRHVPDTERDCACPTSGRCADKRYAWPLFIRDKSRMR